MLFYFKNKIFLPWNKKFKISGQIFNHQCWSFKAINCVTTPANDYFIFKNVLKWCCTLFSERLQHVFNFFLTLIFFRISIEIFISWSEIKIFSILFQIFIFISKIFHRSKIFQDNTGGCLIFASCLYLLPQPRASAFCLSLLPQPPASASCLSLLPLQFN